MTGSFTGSFTGSGTGSGTTVPAFPFSFALGLPPRLELLALVGKAVVRSAGSNVGDAIFCFILDDGLEEDCPGETVCTGDDPFGSGTWAAAVELGEDLLEDPRGSDE